MHVKRKHQLLDIASVSDRCITKRQTTTIEMEFIRTQIGLSGRLGKVRTAS